MVLIRNIHHVHITEFTNLKTDAQIRRDSNLIAPSTQLAVIKKVIRGVASEAPLSGECTSIFK